MADPSPHQPPLNNPNQDDISDPEAEAAAMAAAMGFSSFGQQPTLADDEADDNDLNGRPSKKRKKYNSRVDAYVGSTPQGTGANDVPVQRRVFALTQPKEGGEIRLDDDEINLDDDEGVTVDESITTTLPVYPPIPPKPHFMLPANPSLPPKPQPQHFHASTSNQQGSNNPQIQNHQRDNHHGAARGKRGGHGGGNNHGRDPAKPWYIDYYDPSSNENPWERLEQRRGMEAVGVWLPNRSGGGGRGGFRASDSHNVQQGAQHEGQPIVQQEA